jgi:chromosome condensin MukBEF complex kleisin-like MukF subunit
MSEYERLLHSLIRNAKKICDFEKVAKELQGSKQQFTAKTWFLSQAPAEAYMLIRLWK